MHHLGKFDRLVGSIARKTYQKAVKTQFKNYQCAEDVAQELRLKLWTVMPTLEKVTNKEVYALAKTILERTAIDLVRKNKTREHLNCFFTLPSDKTISCQIGGEQLDEADIEDAIKYEMMSIADGFAPGTDQESVYSYKELLNEMLEWSSNKDPQTKRFIKEMINPSNTTLRTWKRMVEKHPHYKSFHSIPPYTYAKILKISKLKVSRIMHRLREHLTEVGMQPGLLEVH